MKVFKTWYVTYYQLNEVHDDFTIIFEEVLNYFSYFYIINK
jgi:hypothetical protein